MCFAPSADVQVYARLICEVAQGQDFRASLRTAAADVGVDLGGCLLASLAAPLGPRLPRAATVQSPSCAARLRLPLVAALVWPFPASGRGSQAAWRRPRILPALPRCFCT